MSRRSLLATILLPLFFGASVLALPNGEPNIEGSWDASVKVKDFSTETAGEKETFKVKAPVTFSQNGSDITMTVFPPDDSPFTMTGQIGGGHIWVSGTTENGLPRLAVGHVSKSGKKIKGTLLEAWSDGVTEAKLKIKRAK